jgi:hypothetical protein
VLALHTVKSRSSSRSRPEAVASLGSEPCRHRWTPGQPSSTDPLVRVWQGATTGRERACHASLSERPRCLNRPTSRAVARTGSRTSVWMDRARRSGRTIQPSSSRVELGGRAGRSTTDVRLRSSGRAVRVAAYRVRAPTGPVRLPAAVPRDEYRRRTRSVITSPRGAARVQVGHRDQPAPQGNWGWALPTGSWAIPPTRCAPG